MSVSGFSLDFITGRLGDHEGALKKSQKGPSEHTSMITAYEYKRLKFHYKEGTTFQHLRVPIQLPLPCQKENK